MAEIQTESQEETKLTFPVSIRPVFHSILNVLVFI